MQTRDELLQVNLTPEKIGLLARFPRCFRSLGLSPAATHILGYAYGVGARKDKKTGEWMQPTPLNTTYVQLCDELGVCRETVRRAAQELEGAGVIERERNEDGTTAWKIVGDINIQKGYDALPLYLHTVRVRRHGKGPWIRIPASARKVLAYMMNKGEDLKARRCVGSVSSIAKDLAMARSTVLYAVDFLLQSDLITRPEHEKGSCADHKRSVYHIKETLYKYKDEGKLARMSPEAQARVLEKRRREYYKVILPKQRSEAAKAYSRWIDENKELVALRRAIGKLAPQLAKAELGMRGARPLSDLQNEQRALETKEEALLVALDYKEEKRLPEYYIRCACCHDTGQAANGTLCDCWKKAVTW